MGETVVKSNQDSKLLSKYSKWVGFNGPIAGQGSEQNREQLRSFFENNSALVLRMLTVFGWSGLAHDAKDEIARRKAETKANRNNS